MNDDTHELEPKGCGKEELRIEEGCEEHKESQNEPYEDEVGEVGGESASSGLPQAFQQVVQFGGGAEREHQEGPQQGEFRDHQHYR